MTPVLIQHVTSIDDIKAQLKRINLTTYLEAILLCEVNIEVMFESEVISITLVEFTTMILHVRVITNPMLHHCTLHISSQLRCSEVITKDCFGKCISREVSLFKLHLINLSICWDKEEVVTICAIFVNVTIIIDTIWRATLSLIDKTYGSLPLFLCTIVYVIVSRSLNTVRNIVSRIAQLWVVRVTISIIISPVTLSNR